MEMAVVMYGHSQYDNEFWSLLGNLTENDAYEKPKTPYDQEGLDYFELFPIFMMCGANIKNGKCDTLIVEVSNKEKFLERLEKEVPERCYTPATKRQLSYLKSLFKHVNKDEKVKKLIYHFSFNDFLSKSEAGLIIGYLSAVSFNLQDKNYEGLQCESLEMERNRLKKYFDIEFN